MRKTIAKSILLLGNSTDQIINDEYKKCSKCNSELVIITAQTRSADEGMTVFYNCKKCKKTVKV